MFDGTCRRRAGASPKRTRSVRPIEPHEFRIRAHASLVVVGHRVQHEILTRCEADPQAPRLPLDLVAAELDAGPLAARSPWAARGGRRARRAHRAAAVSADRSTSAHARPKLQRGLLIRTGLPSGVATAKRDPQPTSHRWGASMTTILTESDEFTVDAANGLWLPAADAARVTG